MIAQVRVLKFLPLTFPHIIAWARGLPFTLSPSYPKILSQIAIADSEYLVSLHMGSRVPRIKTSKKAYGAHETSKRGYFLK